MVTDSRETIENLLLEDLLEARARFESQQYSAAEFALVIKRFNNFILNGNIPEDLTGETNGSASPAGLTRFQNWK